MTVMLRVFRTLHATYNIGNSAIDNNALPPHATDNDGSSAIDNNALLQQTYLVCYREYTVVNGSLRLTS